MNIVKLILTISLCCVAYGQTTTYSTTLTSPLGAPSSNVPNGTIETLYVASTANMVSAFGNNPGSASQWAFIDKEMMPIVTVINSTTVRALRGSPAGGQGATIPAAHNAAAVVYFGPISVFISSNSDPAGACNINNFLFLPVIVIGTGDQMTCTNGTWTLVSGGTSNNASNLPYTTPFTGGVQQTQAAKNAQVVSVMDFGATGNGTANDLTAINACIQAAPATGWTCYFPPGSYFISGSGTELILVSKPVSLLGAGGVSSRILVDSATAGTVDIARIFNPGGALTNNFVNMKVEGLYFLPKSGGTPAKNAINIDATTAAISRLTISKNWLSQFGGYGVTVTNPTCGDGFFLSTIGPTNIIFGGINLTCAGDSINVEENNLLGTHAGVEVALETSASQLDIGRNNITSSGCAVHLASGRRTKIHGNNIENPSGTSCTNASLIDIDGQGGNPAIDVEIKGNFLGAQDTSNVNCIRVNYANLTDIQDNVCSYGGTGVGVVLTANSQNTLGLGQNNNNFTNASWLTDSGVPSQFTQFGGTGSGYRVIQGTTVTMTGFTDSGWTVLNGAPQRIISISANNIVFGNANVTGTYTSGATVTNFTGSSIGPFTIDTASTSGGIVTVHTTVSSGVFAASSTANTAWGYNAFATASSGSNNTAFGFAALGVQTNASQNTAFGSSAGQSLTTSNSSTLIGHAAGNHVTSGTQNTVVGELGCTTLTTGADNICLGFGTDVSSASASHRTVVGDGASGTQDNTVQLGRSTDMTKVGAVAFASLGSVPLAGSFIYCTDCTAAATCAGSGTGHLAVSNGTNWTCQ